MKTFVLDDGRLIGVIEHKVEVPYWTPYGSQVQIRPEYEFIDTGERLGTNESAPGWTIEEQAPLGARALEPLFNK
ncbi:hypothetical protein [Pseudomonas fluorescens]|uniref:Uncharacterized protein n=2 Tax=Pseudomonas fluorescens TaxID=294 RepID=A0ABY1TF26_PSEFL|nr:hypothetical protein [Pseudomonas fluorescens]MCI4604594.1 hypothetical protein [Pseudomonas fluorescens]RMO76633.1 hypothetical protein ALQ35_200038 [Pseudomonas fluorescens]SNY10003.1 hypothetical protein SAMN04488487_2993 [Pseudomonas fluorescens]SQF89505.1 Uncharacterised protein [Pseudomonas fluorescens]